jgi:hypothetical protein
LAQDQVFRFDRSSRSDSENQQADQIGNQTQNHANESDHAAIMPQLGSGRAARSVHVRSSNCGAQPWNSGRSCWFNNLYARVVPSDAVELTSAYLDRSVAITVGRHRLASATLQNKQELAAMIHLCGTGAGDGFARRAFRLIDGQRCGDHDARTYLARVNAMKSEFSRLARNQDERN